MHAELVRSRGRLLLMLDNGVPDLVAGLATRHVFLTGKGGVGKTSTACALAVGLAGLGRRVLLVSTDPASNLAEVLGQEVATHATAIAGVPGLSALNVDPEAAAAAYRERVVGPYRGVLPDSAVARVEEQLSGACTVEIAAFDEFTALLTDPAMAGRFEHVLFDTAPTGHTLRLLALPAAWSGFIGDGTGTSCLGPLSGMTGQQQTYTRAVAALGDPTSTTLVLVARPDTASLLEAARASTELRDLGLGHQRLVVNGVFTATPGVDDRLAGALAHQARSSVEQMPHVLRALPRTTVGLRTRSPVGIAELRALALGAPCGDAPTGESGDVGGSTTFDSLVDSIAVPGTGLVLSMGKGGVGKTTVAAAVAVALAERGYRVHLTTTDPAAHVDAAIGGAVEGLRVSRIDPVAETAAYTAEVLASAGAGLDEDARAVLAEDLASPCTEEIAVFHAFARTVASARAGFVVVDTAPTGHTVLLLDAARGYHAELARQSGHQPDHVVHLLDRLRDRERTHVLLVALPEATPVHEAAHLQRDLARSGITPSCWVVNQSLAAADPTDPLLTARAAGEVRYLREVADLSDRCVVLPRVAESPVGVARLRALTATPVSA